jgi:hypothetical protein
LFLDLSPDGWKAEYRRVCQEHEKESKEVRDTLQEACKKYEDSVEDDEVWSRVERFTSWGPPSVYFELPEELLGVVGRLEEGTGELARRTERSSCALRRAEVIKGRLESWLEGELETVMEGIKRLEESFQMEKDKTRMMEEATRKLGQHNLGEHFNIYIV